MSKLRTYPLLVLGHPRSGTGFMAQALTVLGCDVGHEEMGAAGTSSWMFAAQADAVPYTTDGTTSLDVDFERVIHVVRSPEKVIASMAFTSLPDLRSTNFMSRYIRLDTSVGVVEQAVQTWLGWNKLIAARRPDVRIKVEEAMQVLPELLVRWGLLKEPPKLESVKPPPSDYNKRPHRPLTWREIAEQIPGGLFREAVEYSRELGYEPDLTGIDGAVIGSQRATVVGQRKPLEDARRAARGKCIVLVPTFSHIENQTDRLLKELESLGYKVRRAFGNAAIDQARNRLATDAIAEGFEELMWIDADMGFPVEAIDRLRSHALPMVTVIASKKGQRALACEVLPGTKKLTFGQGGGLTEVKYAGTGFLLTRRQLYLDMIQKLPLPLCNQGRGNPLYPFFQPLILPIDQGNWYLGEDYAFCERARRCGYSTFADTTIRLDHIGRYRYSWEDAGSDVKRFGTYEYHIT